MLYLLESSGFYKIGYAENVEKRMIAYYTHNPNVELLDQALGTKEDEARLHKILDKYRYKGEWFYAFDEVIYVWLDYVKLTDQKMCAYDYSSFGGRCEIESSIYPLAEKWEEETEGEITEVRQPTTFTLRGCIFPENCRLLLKQ